MALYSDNLYTMVGRVKAGRPLAGDEQVRTWINNAIRNVINKRTYWVDLRKMGIIPVPDQVIAGNIATQPNSNLVTGIGTGWPVSDVVNTTLAEPVISPGFEEVQLASISGVDENSILWVDGGTGSAEAVPVMRINRGGFGPPTIVGRFMFPHNAGVSATQSSLVQRQLRTGFNHPIFSIMAVPDAGTLVLDNAWGGPALNNVSYYILKMYYTLFPNIRRIIFVVDQQQGIPLNWQRTQQELNVTDPQRTDNSDPLAFVSAWPNPNGNMQWEVWPAPTSARQIQVLATLQWPELVNPEDLPPSFLEPTIFTDMAIAEGMRHKLSKDDPWYDLKAAQQWQFEADKKIQDALIGDEDRAVMDYQSMLSSMLPMIGANSHFSLAHAVEAVDWSF